MSAGTLRVELYDAGTGEKVDDYSMFIDGRGEAKKTARRLRALAEMGALRIKLFEITEEEEELS